MAYRDSGRMPARGVALHRSSISVWMREALLWTCRAGAVLVALLTLLGCSSGGGGSRPNPDFTLGHGIAALTIQAGGTGSLPVTVTRLEGHAEAISLALEAPPPGISGSGSIPSGGTSGTLTLSIARTAAQQTHLLTIRGTSGALQRTVSPTLSVTVTPPQDFTLEAPTAALKVLVGQAVTIPVTTERVAGHTDAITLSLEGAPLGLSGSGIVAAGSNLGTLTVQAASDTAAQTYPLTIKGQSGSESRVAASPVPLRVYDQPGSNRLTALSIEQATHPMLTLGPMNCDLVDTVFGGTVSGTVPGGTQPTFLLSFTTDGGTVMAGGVTVTSPVYVDLRTTPELSVIDGAGKPRHYDLQVRDSGLPSVIIRTEGGVPILSKDDYVQGDLTILGGSVAYAQSLLTTSMKIKGRGNSTWAFPKKPYRLSFNAATSVVGLPAAKNWVLLANYVDMSLMRNGVVFGSAPVVPNLKFTPNSLPVDLYLNGAYQGTYAMGDQIEVGPTRVAIEKPTLLPDTGYLLEANSRSPLEGGREGVDYFRTGDGQIFDFKSPKPENLTADQRTYLQGYFKQVEDSIKAGAGYEELIDVPSFIDWLILAELAKSQDSMFMSSVYLHKDKGQKLKMGPIWDFDLAMGNSNYGFIGGFEIKDPRGWFPSYAPWIENLLGLPSFRAALKARWNEVKGSLQAAAFASVDSSVAALARSQKANFRLWLILGVGDWPTPPELIAADTWEKQVEALRGWLTRRFDWMDQTINASY